MKYYPRLVVFYGNFFTVQLEDNLLKMPTSITFRTGMTDFLPYRNLFIQCNVNYFTLNWSQLYYQHCSDNKTAVAADLPSIEALNIKFIIAICQDIALR